MTLPVIVPRYFDPNLTVQVGTYVVAFAKGTGYEISFNIQRSLSTTPDSCTVSIGNILPVTANAMLATFSALGPESRTIMSVRGGYGLVSTGLFIGDVRTFVSSRRDGPDLWTDVTADDGGYAYSEVAVPPELRSTAGLTAQNMVDIAATLMQLIPAPSVAAAIAAGDPSVQGPYTCVTIGKAHELLDAAARRLYCRWWIRDGQIHFSRLGIPTTNRPAIVANAQNVVGSVSFGGSGTITLPMLFDPNLVPDSQVQFERAMFRIETVQHTGSTRGGLWTSTVQGKAL